MVLGRFVVSLCYFAITPKVMNRLYGNELIKFWKRDQDHVPDTSYHRLSPLWVRVLQVAMLKTCSNHPGCCVRPPQNPNFDLCQV